MRPDRSIAKHDCTSHRSNMDYHGLSWRLSRNMRQDLATGSDSVSKIVLRSYSCFGLISVHTIKVWKGPRSPKHIATIAFCDPIFHPLSLLLGWGPCGDRILRSCLQKGPATTPANYDHCYVAQAQAPTRVKVCACMTSIWIGLLSDASRIDHLRQGLFAAIASYKSPPRPHQHNSFQGEGSLRIF